MPQNDFVPWATGSGANVYSVPTYTANAARQSGVVDGEADPLLANNAWRQGTTMAAVIAGFLAQAGYDARDNGDVTTLLSNFLASLDAEIAEQTGPLVVTTINQLSIVGGRLSFFSYSGSWQCPAGVTKARIRGQAGGGGGGGGNGYAGAGGLGGNYFEGVFDVVPNTTYTVTVGLGGIAGGGGGGGAPGGNGGLTRFGPAGGGAFATALGGTGGGSGGSAGSGNVGVTGTPPGLSGIIFPHGGFELAGGAAQNGIIFAGANIGGIGGGSQFSATSPSPYANGQFNSLGYGGGGSGGAGASQGGTGSGGLLIVEY